ncbi:MAG TPA: DinB family protein [Tepidisphaeraceae bacterium]|nr:DinB family protein [Tepidisphaeraceae bacterium]
MTHPTMLALFSDSLKWLHEAVADVDEARAADQPAGVVNHPAWTMTHLCVAHDFTLQLLGGAPLCPGGWAAIASPGSTPQPDRAMYPALSEAFAMLDRQHVEIDRLVRAAAPEQFAAESPEPIRAFAPTIGHVVAYMLLAHENYHLAQINVWKRVAAATR